MKEINNDRRLSLSERLGYGVDRVIGIFSPAAAAKRYMLRNVMAASGAYRSGRGSRLRDDWSVSAGSMDQDLLMDLPTLRERSRELNRNDPHAAGITDTVVTNVVGTGIRPQSRVETTFMEGVSQAQVLDFQKRAERSWQKWIPFADAQDRMDFYEIQALVVRQILENGEALVMPLMLKDQRRPRPYMLSLDIIEADRLGYPLTADADQKRTIRSGVEIGERGEPVAYWIRKTHPGDYRWSYKVRDHNAFVRYSAFNDMGRPNILHLYWMKRPGQTRGVPFFAPVMSYFKDMASYLEAELVAARVAACFAAIIKKTDVYTQNIAAPAETNTKGQRLQGIEPGMFEYLQPGEEITQINPNRPGNNFEPFVERYLRDISASLGLCYETVSKDFSKTNYSSARASMLEAFRFFKSWQSWISRKLCQPTWEMFLEEAYLSGDLPAVPFYQYRQDWTKAQWIAPGRGWVDPTKEVEASRSAIEGHISTLADEAAQAGRDWEEVLEQRAREEAKRKELGLDSASTAKSQKSNQDPVQPEEPPAVPARKN